MRIYKYLPALLLYSVSCLATEEAPVHASEEISELRSALSEIDIDSVEGGVRSPEVEVKPSSSTDDCKGDGGCDDGVRNVRDMLRSVKLRFDRDADADGFTLAQGDCDDDDPTTFPNAYDGADGIDNNCDGLVDNSADTPP